MYIGNRKLIIKVCSIVALVCCFVLYPTAKALGQDKPAAPKGPPGQMSKALRKKQWKKQRQIDRATKQALNAHLKNQTKAVRKSMKENAKKAAKNNKRG
jgi:hypothetical protein